MVTVEEVRAFASALPRTTEVLVHDRVKFRVGKIVYVESEPGKFMMPIRSDLRFNWVLVRLEALDATEMRELVLDAWRMVVPKRVAAAHEESA